MTDVIEVTATQMVEVFSDSCSLDVSVTSSDSVDVSAGHIVEVYGDNERVIELFWPGQAYDDYNPNNPFHTYTTTPPTPLGLSASAGFSSVFLNWVAASYSNHDYTEVWRSVENNIATAGLVGSPKGNSHNDPAETSSVYYYWVRFVSLAGVEGPYSSGATSGVIATPGTDNTGTLASLQGAFSESHLTQSLLTRLGGIETTASALAQETIDRITAVAGEANDRGVAIGAAISQEVLDREASILLAVALETADRNAAVGSESIVRFDEDFALGARIDLVQSGVDDNTAAILTETTARTTADSAIASQVTTLSTTVGGNTTSIQTNASSIDGLEGQYTVKIDVSSGHVAGFGLANTANTGAPGSFSEFTILANRFSVAAPGSATLAFAVDTATNRVSIDGAYIKNATITSAEITDATITSAKITDAAITNAKIGTASVTTLKIGDEQVTVPRFSRTDGTYTTTGTTLVEVATASLDSGGSPILVDFSCRAEVLGLFVGDAGTYVPVTLNIGIYRNSVLIYSRPVAGSNSSGDWAESTASVRFQDDSPGTGTITYSIRAGRSISDSGAGAKASYRNLLLLGVKR